MGSAKIRSEQTGSKPLKSVWLNHAESNCETTEGA
jgi:hypothetical protein